MRIGIGWFIFLLGGAGLLLACGDDDSEPMGVDASVDVAAEGSPPINCTEAPIVTPGMEAPREPGIDPTPIDMARAFEAGEVDPATLPEDGAVFPLGIQAGEMTDSTVLLWTNVTATTNLSVQVFRDDPTIGRALVADEAVTPVEGYVHAEVTGLAPATWYEYAFVAGDGAMPTARSAIGRFRTAPAPDMALKLRLGATTCTGTAGEDRPTFSPFPALSFLSNMDIDLLLHLGDISYNDNERTQAEYRAEWATTLSEPGYRDLLSTAGWYMTWDDHEVDNNWDAEMFDTARRDIAINAFYENLAIRPGPEGQLWRTHRWGQTAEFFVMDLRSERQPSTLGSGAEVFVSREQLDFVKAQLMASTAHFKVVLSSVNITGLNDIWDANISFEDRWEGFGAQREELLSFIQDNNLRNVWFLAGDIHLGFVARLEPEGERYSHMWEITVGPGGSSENPLGSLRENGLDVADGSFQCDMFVFDHGRPRMATVLEFDPIADTVRIIFQDPMSQEVLYDETLQQEMPF
ncbi:MAG: alkaline phosphatase D family protein [Myxococcota bacterium]